MKETTAESIKEVNGFVQTAEILISGAVPYGTFWDLHESQSDLLNKIKHIIENWPEDEWNVGCDLMEDYVKLAESQVDKYFEAAKAEQSQIGKLGKILKAEGEKPLYEKLFNSFIGLRVNMSVLDARAHDIEYLAMLYERSSLAFDAKEIREIAANIRSSVDYMDLVIKQDVYQKAKARNDMIGFLKYDDQPFAFDKEHGKLYLMESVDKTEWVAIEDQGRCEEIRFKAFEISEIEALTLAKEKGGVL